jgi:hypothetical protein
MLGVVANREQLGNSAAALFERSKTAVGELAGVPGRQKLHFSRHPNSSRLLTGEKRRYGREQRLRVWMQGIAE